MIRSSRLGSAGRDDRRCGASAVRDGRERPGAEEGQRLHEVSGRIVLPPVPWCGLTGEMRAEAGQEHHGSLAVGCAHGEQVRAVKADHPAKASPAKRTRGRLVLWMESQTYPQIPG